MIARIRSRIHLPSPAMLVALAAVFLSLGGSAYALKGRNTVASNDIRSQAVKRGDLARDAVAGGKVLNGSIKGADLAVDYSIETSQLTVPGNQVASATASCDQGDVASGGGWNTGAPAPDQQNAEASYPAGPSSAPTGWTVVLDNKTASPITNTVYAVCNDSGN